MRPSLWAEAGTLKQTQKQVLTQYMLQCTEVGSQESDQEKPEYQEIADCHLTESFKADSRNKLM